MARLSGGGSPGCKGEGPCGEARDPGHPLPASPARRPKLPFRAVNRRGAGDYQADLQRHHLLPCQLQQRRGLSRMFDAIGADRFGLDDFRRNGVLLPANCAAAVRLRMPLHRGPHHAYTSLVAERVGQVESEWSRLRLRAPDLAVEQAVMRIALLQRALRRRLLSPGGARLRLNRFDPMLSALDFSELDAMAEQLWADTASAGDG